MKQTTWAKRMFAVIIAAALLLGGMPATSSASTTSSPALVISQLKMTSSNGQFITLYNAGSTALDMSKYELEYFNSYDLTKATSSKLIALSGSLAAHSYFLVNDSSLLLCYQLTIDSVSLGLSSTAGMVEVLALNQNSVGSSVTPQLLDYVSWSKTAVSGAQTLPTNSNAFLQRQPVDSQNNPAVTAPGSGSWQAVQPDPANACSLVTGNSSGPTTAVATGLSQLLPATEPPATILGAAGTDESPTALLPAADVGLMTPVITETLPNPLGTGNDSTDEFVELYNPNPVAFDLSGFELVAGTTVLHEYLFPIGASLPAQSFTSYYASSTGLSLSNSGGQVQLLDPAGNTIGSSAPYDTANDGQAWALANGQWYWTTTVTPGMANVITQPVAKAKTSAAISKASSSSKFNQGVVKGAKTTKSKPATKTPRAKKAASTKLSANTVSANPAPATPIHFSTLALIAGLALLYGVYEYRSDLGNHLHKLRTYLRARRAHRA